MESKPYLKADDFSVKFQTTNDKHDSRVISFEEVIFCMFELNKCFQNPKSSNKSSNILFLFVLRLGEYQFWWRQLLDTILMNSLDKILTCFLLMSDK